jgi:hypothetical protein
MPNPAEFFRKPADAGTAQPCKDGSTLRRQPDDLTQTNKQARAMANVLGRWGQLSYSFEGTQKDCTDWDLIVSKWQAMAGLPVTGVFTQAVADSVLAERTRIDPEWRAAVDKWTAARQAFRSAGGVSTSSSVRESVSAPTRPRDLRQGTYGMEWHVDGCFQRHQGAQQGRDKAILDCMLGPVPEALDDAAAAPVTTRIDVASLVLGDDFDVATSRLAGPLCRSTNTESIACRARLTLTEMCGSEDRALVEFRQTVYRKIDRAIRYGESRTQFHDDVAGYPRLEDELEACKERYRAAPERSAELLFDGVTLRWAQLTFAQRRLAEIRFRATGVDAVSRWFTSRYGAPTVNVSTVGDVSVRRVPASEWTDDVFIDDHRRTIRHQTWSSKGIAVQSEGDEFTATAVRER